MSSTIKVNNIQNLAGDDSGIDLSTNDQIILKTANTTALTIDSSQNATFANKLATTNLGAGAVLQVIQAITTTEVSTTSTSFSDSGLTASITPTATSSKILILFNMQQFSASADAPSKLKLIRGSTEIEEYGYQGYLGSASLMHMGGYIHLDSPSTTSATTYKVTFNSVNGHNVLCQYDDTGGDGISSMLLMEIAQ